MGPREEDIAEAQAHQQAAQATLALLQHKLTQAELRAPQAAVVRSCLLEVGACASPTAYRVCFPKICLVWLVDLSGNLSFFGKVYGLYGRRLQTRLQEIVQQFGLEAYARTGADLLPGGKAVSGHGQRLTARVRDRVFG